MKILLDLPGHKEDEIVLESLKWARDDLSKTKHKIFSNNLKKDRELIKKHVQALDLIIKYYSIET